MTGLTEEMKRRITHYLSHAMKADTIILFGSAARDSMRGDSDIDVAFMSDVSYTPYDCFMAAGELASLLGRDVDLVDFRQASTVLQAQITVTGTLLLDRKPVDREYAFMRALKAYALLNEERQAILEKLSNSQGDDDGTRHYPQ